MGRNVRSIRQQTQTSEFYCTECGRRGINVTRRSAKKRASGHLKKLWCPYCKKEVNFAEVEPFGKYTYEDFKEEFDSGRFVDGQRIPLPHKKSRKCFSTCSYNDNNECQDQFLLINCNYRTIEG